MQPVMNPGCKETKEVRTPRDQWRDVLRSDDGEIVLRSWTEQDERKNISTQTSQPVSREWPTGFHRLTLTIFLPTQILHALTPNKLPK